jgi:hypothetical protein
VITADENLLPLQLSSTEEGKESRGISLNHLSEPPRNPASIGKVVPSSNISSDHEPDTRMSDQFVSS